MLFRSEAMTLADKIVLLHTGALIEEKGSVAQVGSPMTLYHRPASLFVAEFIGSPKMNLLPAKLVRAEATYAVVELAGQQVTAAVDARGLSAGASVQIGIRPEHITIGSVGEGCALPATLMHMERLGDSSLLYVSIGAGLPTLNVKVEGSATTAVGERLTLRLMPEELHLFDATSKACERPIVLPS